MKWTKVEIQKYIDEKIQESLVLDYKAADSLQKKEQKKKEITKDVSAMANSDGGLIIYGIKEKKDNSQYSFPDTIDPIDQTEITKEWLQQVINNIRPKLEGIVINPIKIEGNLVVYVIEIPKSSTAHQATDFRYYKRYNALSMPMEDYEIRDVMNRSKSPKFNITFKIKKKKYIDKSAMEVARDLRGIDYCNQARTLTKICI